MIRLELDDDNDVINILQGLSQLLSICTRADEIEIISAIKRISEQTLAQRTTVKSLVA